MNKVRLIVVALLLASVHAVALESDTLADLILQHEIRLPEAWINPLPTGPVLLVLDLQESKVRGLIDRNIIQGMVRQEFREYGIALRIYSGDLGAELSQRRVPLESVLAPKLVIEIEMAPDESGRGYEVASNLSFIEYEKIPHSRRVVARRAWSDRRDIKGIPKDAVEDTLGDFIQVAVGKFLKHRGGVSNSEKRPKVAKASEVKEGDSSSLSYSLKWNDPDNRRNHFFVGATAGTPALVNANLGFWGSRAFPFVASVSGMYYSDATRGVQLDASYAFINSGNLRHALGVALDLVNETSTNTTNNLDVFNRVTQTNIETVNQLMPYAGPVYTLDWKSFRIQGGVGLRLDSDSQTGVQGHFPDWVYATD